MRAIHTGQTGHEFSDLVDAYGDAVYKFCRSLAYSRADADDLFQDTFLRAFESRSKMGDNPRSFLFSTALYTWKSQKRKYARRGRLAPAGPLDDTLAGGVGVEESLIEREEIRIVRESVEALPEKFKIPTVLYYTVEMCVRDIAATLQLPVGTVKSRLFMARKLIEKGLARYEE